MKVTQHNILLTGGAGYLGTFLTREFLTSGLINDFLLVYSRDELKHFNLSQTFSSKNHQIRLAIGDVRDRERIDELCKGVDVVIHLAAMKHVGTCEENPGECYKTNVAGTENVIWAARHNQVKKLIFISTDKAVAPVSVYGNSKQAGERLVLKANKDGLKTTVIRLGNLIGSTGSIVDKLSKHNAATPFDLHSSELTRFADHPKNAWQLILKAIHEDLAGTVLIPKLKALKIKELVEVFLPDTKITFSQVRSFEKIHEVLIAGGEMERALENEHFFIIPMEKPGADEALEKYRSLPASGTAYRSDTVARIGPDELQEMFGDRREKVRND